MLDIGVTHVTPLAAHLTLREPGLSTSERSTLTLQLHRCKSPLKTIPSVQECKENPGRPPQQYCCRKPLPNWQAYPGQPQPGRMSMRRSQCLCCVPGQIQFQQSLPTDHHPAMQVVGSSHDPTKHAVGPSTSNVPFQKQLALSSTHGPDRQT